MHITYRSADDVAVSVAMTVHEPSTAVASSTVIVEPTRRTEYQLPAVTVMAVGAEPPSTLRTDGTPAATAKVSPKALARVADAEVENARMVSWLAVAGVPACRIRRPAVPAGSLTVEPLPRKPLYVVPVVPLRL